MQLILASKSPRRIELFAKLSADFDIFAADIDESSCASLPAPQMCEQLAQRKAAAVHEMHPQAAVVGCDTVVELGGEVFGKPTDKNDARRMLQALSGAVHTVYTGVCILYAHQIRSFVCKTSVEFYPLSPEEIESYISTGEPYDKAGAYGIQDEGALLVHSITGDYFNVMGLPVARLSRELKAMEIL